MIVITTATWAQSHYTSFGDLKANAPEGQEVIVDFNDVQVIWTDFWDDEQGRVYFWILKDKTLCVECDSRVDFGWENGQILNGTTHVDFAKEDDWGINYLYITNDDPSGIQVTGEKEVIPVDVSLSDLSLEKYGNEFVRLEADVVKINNSSTHWNIFLTDGNVFCGCEAGDDAFFMYPDGESKVTAAINPVYETMEDCIDDYNYQTIRRKVVCTGILFPSPFGDKDSKIYRFYKPKKVEGPYEYVPVTFKEKFEGYTSFYWNEYAGADASFWITNFYDYQFEIPENVTAYGYKVESGKGKLIKLNEENIGTDPVILKLNDNSFENGDVTIDFKASWGGKHSTALDENMLLGYNTAEETSVEDDTESYKFYRLTLNAKQEKGSIGFYYGAADGGPFTTSPHKVFLAVPRDEANNANFFGFDETTAIKEATTTKNGSDAIYTLSGVRVSYEQISKGIYIANGKKIVIK